MKLYAVGDIHGCYNEMLDLMGMIFDDIGFDDDDPAKIVFLGDYIDRGPDSFLVVQYLDWLQQEKKGRAELVFLKGNHEDMLIRGILNQESRMQAESFWYNGGYQTKRSYENYDANFEDHREFYESLQRYHRHDDFFFVHAGLPATETMEEALLENGYSEDDLYWSRAWNDWDGEFPDNVFVIHGHTPVPQVQFNKNQINIDTGCVFGSPESEDYGQLTAVRLDGRTKEEIKVFQVRKQE